MNSEEEFGFDEFAEDVKAACQIERSVLDRLVHDLAEESGFLDTERVAEIAQRICGSDKPAHAAWRLVLGLHEWINGTDLTAETLSQVAAHHVETDEEGQQTFLRVITALAGPFDGIERQENAVRVSNSIGNRATSLSFICDLRPVFDLRDRNTIEGLIPLTTLHLETVDSDGNGSITETVMSVEDLQELIREARIALVKLHRLRELAEEAGKPIPSVLLTNHGDDESES